MANKETKFSRACMALLGAASNFPQRSRGGADQGGGGSEERAVGKHSAEISTASCSSDREMWAALEMWKCTWH